MCEESVSSEDQCHGNSILMKQMTASGLSQRTEVAQVGLSYFHLSSHRMTVQLCGDVGLQLSGNLFSPMPR